MSFDGISCCNSISISNNLCTYTVKMALFGAWKKLLSVFPSMDIFWQLHQMDGAEMAGWHFRDSSKSHQKCHFFHNFLSAVHWYKSCHSSPYFDCLQNGQMLGITILLGARSLFREAWTMHFLAEIFYDCTCAIIIIIPHVQLWVQCLREFAQVLFLN